MTPDFQSVDLLHASGTVTVQWRSAPGEFARSIDTTTRTRLEQQLAALTDAELQGGPARMAAAQRLLGETLYQLLDGPERALQRRVEAARRDGQSLHLIIRLRSTDRKALGRHPALGWQLQLLAAPAPDGPLALDPDVTLTVQLGEADVASPEMLRGGRLQVLFMAYAPRDVEPSLDYEAEEEHILDELAPFVEERRLVVRVAEDGSLAELRRRLMRRAFDVVHLTGHGVITDRGPRLLMEDETGARDDISPEQLLKALRDGRGLPRLIVLASCHTADQRDDLPSFAAELLQGGIPCVVGWTRPVLDDVATDAAAELYHRLCSGEVASLALARARQRLHRDDQGRLSPTHAWATLQLLTTRPSGFAIDPDESPVREGTPTPEVTYRMLGGRMRVLERGFVGRRRELQALGRILRRGLWATPGEAEHPIAGAVIVGMKGQGKSCLVGRTLARHAQDVGEMATVVMHGALDELSIAEAFRTEASRAGDDAAEALLRDGSRSLMDRIERLLRHHWRERRLVIVLDDFEKNLDIPGEGEALLQPLAAALLEVLVPVCRDEQPKLLLTTTARFALPARCHGALAELPLGALDSASVRKLWMRGQSSGELAHVLPSDWSRLCERLGRNARILDWARQLLAGKTPEEVRAIVSKAGQELPVWTGSALDEAKQDELAALFLKHMAVDEARSKVGPDALAFVERARVYEVPVPVDAFAGLTEGLTVMLDRHVIALANLGLLEVGSEDGQRVYRVSPLVKEEFDAPDSERWHGVAAEYWWKTAEQGDHLHVPSVFLAWNHALRAKRQDIADAAAEIISLWMDRWGDFAKSAALGRQHLAVFPESVVGLNWAGYALFRAGAPRESRVLLKQGVELATSLPTEDSRLRRVRDSFARVLAALGEYAEARWHFENLMADEEQNQPDGSSRLAAFLHALAGVLSAQGDFDGARAHLERSLDIQKKVHGTEEHPNIATSYAGLGSCLKNLNLLDESEAALRKAQGIRERVYRTRDHHMYAETEVSLAFLLLQRDRAEEALPLLQHAVAVLLAHSPTHPLLAELKNLFSDSRVNPSDLANSALAARKMGVSFPAELVEGLHALKAAGAPHDVVAGFLEQVARGGLLPSIPEGLPDDVAGFVASVRKAAEAGDSLK